MSGAGGADRSVNQPTFTVERQRARVIPRWTTGFLRSRTRFEVRGRTKAGIDSDGSRSAIRKRRAASRSDAAISGNTRDVGWVVVVVMAFRSLLKERENG